MNPEVLIVIVSPSSTREWIEEEHFLTGKALIYVKTDLEYYSRKWNRMSKFMEVGKI